MSAHDQLTALDATFLELEEIDDGALMHIGAALLFDPLPGHQAPTIEQVRRHLDERLDLLPRYRQKLDVPRTGGLSWPSWKQDRRFEIEAHVRRASLPSPGDEPDFLEWISDFYSHRLDRSRPLWEIVLLDGLASGRWALVYKTHHCLVDGVGSVDLVALLLGSEVAPEPSATHSRNELTGAEIWPGWLPHPPAPVGYVAGAGLAAGRAGAHALMHPREALEQSRGVIDLLVRDELIAAPSSSLNVPIGTTRRIATVHVELGQLQEVRSALGGTVNDVVLCAAAGALRELLLARGEVPPHQGLREMVPVNIRRDQEDRELGNKVSSLFVELPVAEADPLHRYELLVAATKKRKAGGQARAASLLTGLTELAPPILHASLARSLFAKRLFNVTITNVPGSSLRVEGFGAELVDVVPIVPLASEHTLGIAVVSYGGGLTFGLYADRATTPDLDVLRRGLIDSLRELTALAQAAVRAA
ncbi:MAG: wax ester/triacylglycerol synthase family O-acyltransferase [Solirubrobacteraceae bacterium]